MSYLKTTDNLAPVGPGFYRMSKTEYLSDPLASPSLSASIAHLLVSRSPAHAWSAHPKGAGYRKDPTAAMLNGTVIDALLLGDDAGLVESPHEEYRTNVAKEWRDSMLAAGKTPVKAKDLKHARYVVEAIAGKLEAQGVALTGEHQVTAVWEEGDVMCRGRFDHFLHSEGVIYDLKTCDSAHPDAIASKMHAFGYDIQHAAYTSAVEHLVPDLAGRVQMLFIFAEVEPPYEVVVVPPAGTMRALGKHRWEKAVRLWGECLKAGKWPGYELPAAGIEAKPWALVELEQTLVGGSQGITF